jgi:hypothetical protein
MPELKEENQHSRYQGKAFYIFRAAWSKRESCRAK